ncbi:MAG: hypothetical protein CMH53_03345 [Myxococcales bacterium]|nr:hypothetical protein [Myxococcales bacterium]|tara:strand:+ start:235 stop:558 length:324 start_codon:yes stop_codon:yes gene_type:complete
MAAAIGVSSTLIESFAPATGFIQEVSADSSVDMIKIKDENGVTKRLLTKKMVSKDITISGQGTVSLGTAVAAGSYSEDTAKVVSAKISESAEGTPEFEVNLKVYSSL